MSHSKVYDELRPYFMQEFKRTCVAKIKNLLNFREYFSTQESPVLTLITSESYGEGCTKLEVNTSTVGNTDRKVSNIFPGIWPQ